LGPENSLKALKKWDIPPKYYSIVIIVVQKLSRISVFLGRFERAQIELESALQAASEYVIRF